MGFLTEEDYKSQIRDFDLDDLTDYGDQARTDAECRAHAEMESYLRDRFDVASIFSEVGSDRNPLMVMYMIDIALYHLFSAIVVPEIRVDRYKAALTWLNYVRKGDINPDLPNNTDARGNEVIGSKIESNRRNGYNW